MVIRMPASRPGGTVDTPLPLALEDDEEDSGAAALSSQAEWMVQNMGDFHASGSPQSQHPLLPGDTLIRTICPR